MSAVENNHASALPAAADLKVNTANGNGVHYTNGLNGTNGAAKPAFRT